MTSSKRELILSEIVSTEETFVYHLNQLKDVFECNIRASNLLNCSEVRTLFDGVDQILAVSNEFLQLCRSKDVIYGFQRVAPFLKIYSGYVSKYRNAVNLIEELRTGVPDFALLLDDLSEQAKHSISASLIAPIQRIPRYELLLSALLRETPPNSESFSKISEILLEVQQVATFINEKIREAESAERLLELQQGLGLSADVNLLEPGRRLLHNVTLHKLSSNGRDSHERQFYLFTDLLVYAKPRLMSLRADRASFTYSCAIPFTAHATVTLCDGDHRAAGGAAGSPDGGERRLALRDGRVIDTYVVFNCDQETMILWADLSDDTRAWYERMRSALTDYQARRNTLRRDVSQRRIVRRSTVRMRKRRQSTVSAAAAAAAGGSRPSSLVGRDGDASSERWSFLGSMPNVAGRTPFGSEVRRAAESFWHNLRGRQRTPLSGLSTNAHIETPPSPSAAFLKPPEPATTLTRRRSTKRKSSELLEVDHEVGHDNMGVDSPRKRSRLMMPPPPAPVSSVSHPVSQSLMELRPRHKQSVQNIGVMLGRIQHESGSDEEDDVVFDHPKALLIPNGTSGGGGGGGGVRDKGKVPFRRAKTVMLFNAFFALGWAMAILGPTLVDLGERTNSLDSNGTITSIATVFTARSVGYAVGAVAGGVLVDRFNHPCIMASSLLMSAASTAVAPNLERLSVMATMLTAQGFSLGVLDTAGNVFCLNLWGRKSPPYLQALHFTFGIGAFVSPLVALPFLNATTVPAFGRPPPPPSPADAEQARVRRGAPPPAADQHGGASKPSSADGTGHGNAEGENLKKNRNINAGAVSQEQKSKVQTPTTKTKPETATTKLISTTVTPEQLLSTTTTVDSSQATVNLTEPGEKQSVLEMASTFVATRSNVQFAYLVVGLYHFIIACCFVTLCMCDWRRPGPASYETEFTVREEPLGMQRFQLLLLVFFFFFAVVGAEVTYGGLIMLFVVEKPLSWTETRGALLVSIFWGSFAAARGISVGIARCLTPTKMLIGSLAICTMAMFTLSLLALSHQLALWLTTAGMGLGLASVFPAGISWTERHLRVTGKAASILVVGASLGSMVLPVVTEFFYKLKPIYMIYFILGVVLAADVLFIFMENIASSFGERYIPSTPGSPVEASQGFFDTRGSGSSLQSLLSPHQSSSSSRARAPTRIEMRDVSKED